MNASTQQYTLTRRKNMRRTVLRVGADGAVRVSAPPWVTKREIDAFVASKAAWIARRQALADTLPAPLTAGVEAEEHKAWIREQLDDLMPLWCARMGVSPEPRVTLKIMKSRWGSCNSQRRSISLNVELGRRGREALEYVLVHELAHLFESNHGPGFYALMDVHLPDWKQRRKALRAR